MCSLPQAQERLREELRGASALQLHLQAAAAEEEMRSSRNYAAAMDAIECGPLSAEVR